MLVYYNAINIALRGVGDVAAERHNKRRPLDVGLRQSWQPRFAIG